MYCKYCERDLPENKFFLAAVVKGVKYKRKKCQDCKNKDQEIRINKIWSEVNEYKKKNPCVKCGFSDYRALQFHHRDPEIKEFAIADMFRFGYSLEKIMMEISKCDILCANCHFILHFDRRHSGSISTGRLHALEA